MQNNIFMKPRITNTSQSRKCETNSKTFEYVPNANLFVDLCTHLSNIYIIFFNMYTSLRMHDIQSPVNLRKCQMPNEKNVKKNKAKHINILCTFFKNNSTYPFQNHEHKHLTRGKYFKG